MLRPGVLALAAAVCVVVAVAIPRGPWADDIYVVAQADMTSSMTVQVDDRQVVVHPPDGYTIGGWGQGSEPSVQITMTGDDGIVHVTIQPGIAPRDALRRGAVSREIVDGATMTVFSRLPPEVVQRMFDELELS